MFFMLKGNTRSTKIHRRFITLACSRSQFTSGVLLAFLAFAQCVLYPRQKHKNGFLRSCCRETRDKDLVITALATPHKGIRCLHVCIRFSLFFTPKIYGRFFYKYRLIYLWNFYLGSPIFCFGSFQIQCYIIISSLLYLLYLEIS